MTTKQYTLIREYVHISDMHLIMHEYSGILAKIAVLCAIITIAHLKITAIAQSLSLANAKSQFCALVSK